MTESGSERPQADQRRMARSRRLVRRVEGSSRLPFLPYGLAPLGALVLLILFALTGFASGAVEDVAARTARQALDHSGASWAWTCTKMATARW